MMQAVKITNNNNSKDKIIDTSQIVFNCISSNFLILPVIVISKNTKPKLLYKLYNILKYYIVSILNLKK